MTKTDFQAVILATHDYSLHPLTQTIHKSLIPVANKPIIFHLISWLEYHGIQDIIIVADVSKMKFHFKGYEGNAKVDVIPLETFDGTADALRQIKDRLFNDVIVLPANLITEAPLHHLTDLHMIKDSLVTCLLVEQTANDKHRTNEDDFDWIGYQDQQIVYYMSKGDYDDDIPIPISLFQKFPKMTMSSQLHHSRVYVFKKQPFELLEEKKHFLDLEDDFLPWLVRAQYHSKWIDNEKHSLISDLLVQTNRYPKNKKSTIECACYILKGAVSFLIDSSTAYMEANRMMIRKLQAGKTESKDSKMFTDVVLGEGTKISEKVSIKRSVIGNNVTIGSNVKIINSVLMDGVVVEENCKIDGCVIASKVLIKEKASLNSCEVGGGFVIERESNLKNESLSANIAVDDELFI